MKIVIKNKDNQDSHPAYFHGHQSNLNPDSPTKEVDCWASRLNARNPGNY
jgi:hypothetical protein